MARQRFNLISHLSERDKVLILSVVVGAVCGVAAVVLGKAIHFIRAGLTSWLKPGFDYVLYLVYPGVGMLIALLFVKFLVRDNIGHGVTRVMEAISKNESHIKPHNMWSSIVASSITIGFGGSVGAEAPIVYAGAAIGSNFARHLGLSYRNMTLLLGCGAAAAISGTFRAPLAGVLFSMEILMLNMSLGSMLPLLLSTVSATVVSYLLHGNSLSFQCNLAPFSIGNIPFYIVLGVFCGGISLYFIWMTLWLEDKLGKLRNFYSRWILCAVGLGLLIFFFPVLYGEGYENLNPLLNGEHLSIDGMSPLSGMLHSKWLLPSFFLLAILLKVFSMTFTNAGGGVGGTFGPTLLIGAFSGFVLARTINLISPEVVPEQNFVLVGMAGILAGAMQAPMTSIFLIAEITGGYGLLLPLILTSAISFGTTRIFEKYSVYTKRLAKAGQLITHDDDQSVLTLLKIADFVETDFCPVEIDATLRQFVATIASSSRNIFPVVDSKGRFQGFVSMESVRRDMFNTELYDKKHVYNYMFSAPDYVYENESMQSVMLKFEKTNAWNLPVVGKDRRYIGFVSKSKIFSSYREELKNLSSY